MSSTVLTVRVHDFTGALPLHGICVGYERGRWRADALAAQLFDAVPEFALTHDELKQLSSANMIDLIRRAAQVVYTSNKAKNRGEIGELLLHILLKQVKNTIPAISKIYFKDAANDTVKGFDAVHVVADANGLELWLGEAKFYRNIGAAIRDVAAELAKHTQTKYLRAEFAAIINKLSPGWPPEERNRLSKLLDPKTSLDVVFDHACIPVLLTYESPTVAGHTKATPAYEQEFTAEVRRHHQAFVNAKLPKDLRIELFLMPLHLKAELVRAFDGRLKAAQAL
jgi:hypothetical protein